MESKN